MEQERNDHFVRVPAGTASLEGDLNLPAGAQEIVVFAHGTGSTRFSNRKRHIARILNESGLATLLIDLLSPEEEAVDQETMAFRFDIRLLAERLTLTIDWLKSAPDTRKFPIGLFGAGTGAAAALVAAADRPRAVSAVVSRSGRPDLAGSALPKVKAATLLIVGGADGTVLEVNGEAYQQLRCEKKLHIIPGATHQFEEPGALDEVARLARQWFDGHLGHE
jgi:putative phosphoribosyl transferase